MRKVAWKLYLYLLDGWLNLPLEHEVIAKICDFSPDNFHIDFKKLTDIWERAKITPHFVGSKIQFYQLMKLRNRGMEKH